MPSGTTMNKTRLIRISTRKYARVDNETGEVVGYEYAGCFDEKQLSKDIDNLVLDQNGELNGDWVGDFEDDEESDFIGSLLDPRYDID